MNSSSSNGARRGTRRRLGHERKADLAGKLPGLAGAADEAVAGARDPGFTQDLLHPCLVPEVPRCRHTHTGYPQSFANLGERDLQLLQCAE
jgi:hypothetical protein